MLRALLLLLLAGSAALAQTGAQLLVICRDEFVPAVQPLVEWRHATGLRTKLVKFSEISTDTAVVRDYIINAWVNWPVKPQYVLLVADPAFFRAKIYGYGAERYYSDHYYGDLEGDWHAEIPVGRFPARTVEQCENMVEKTLSYERSPGLDDSLWPRRLTTVVREDFDADDSIYWNDVRIAALLAASSGFVGCESLSSARGNSSSDVVTAINRGTGLVAYRGRATANWYAPFDVNPAATTNTSMLPLILSFTCETMALDPFDSMVGEAWLKARSVTYPVGAVAFFGNTHSDMNVARLRSAVCRGFFTGLFAEQRHRLGLAALRARSQLAGEYPDSICKDDYRGFNILGDPALPIWTTTPRRLTLQHPTQVTPGPQLLDVAVRSDGNPVADATVCASMDSTVYVCDTTDASGTASLLVAPTDTGRIRLVATGRNLLPCEGTVMVTSVAVAGKLPPSAPPVLSVLPNPCRAQTFVRMAQGAADQLRLYDATGTIVLTMPIDSRPVRLDLAPVRPGVYYICVGTARQKLLVSR